ncbi:MAG: polysaccharide pyruvyl transferase family protein, partial [Clostridia bacterium]|nr:polysaccharide pyruvyl transferase family protein [Clostridia bacterium]
IKRGVFDIVHSHARIPSLIASFALYGTDMCLITTAHAKFACTGLRRYLTRWGRFTVAVSEDIKQYLIDSYDVPPENIQVIPNGIDPCRFVPVKKKNDVPHIVFMSRLDGDCSIGALLLCRIAPSLVKKHGRIKITVGGGGEMLVRVRKMAARVNRALGFECVNVIGRVGIVSSLLGSADIFVGVSRAAMEASMCKASVVLCGNEGFMGRLTEKNFDRALCENLCARGFGKASASALFNSLDRLLSQPRFELEREQAHVRSKLIEKCDISKTVGQTLELYKDSLGSKGCAQNGVLLCGYYGYGNVGDDALLRAAIKRAKNELPNMEIAALTRRGARDTDRFGVRCIARNNLFSVMKAIKKCRYFVFGGGTLLQDRTSLRSLVYYTALLRYAEAHNAECLLWGNGIGVFKKGIGQLISGKALSGCSYIGVRDDRSARMVKRLIPSSLRGRVVIEDDLSNLIDESSAARADFILKRLFGEYVPRFVVVAVCKRGPKKGIERAVRKAVELGKQVVFVVMHRGDDTKISRTLCKKYKGHLLTRICFADLVAIARRSEGVYSMRLHALIAAKRAGVPFRGFGSDVKVTDFS